MDEQVVTLLEQSIQAAPGSVRLERALSELDGWDSMGMVSLVGEVFERFQVELAVDELSACVTVGDLVALVRSRVASRHG